MSVVHMINNNSSSCRNCMVLIRMLVLLAMLNNVKLTAKHVTSQNNKYADLLSRLQYRNFRRISKKEGKHFNNKPDDIPDDMWPISKIYLTD